MRKRIVPAISVRSVLDTEQWLDLEGCAEIEVSSEDPGHPIEAALLPGNGRGWKATAPGKQTVRILFDSPQTLKRMRLVFIEETVSRTQEFVLRWSDNDDDRWTDIVRQQYNFTPVASEVEDYRMDLHGVRRVELEITPSISGAPCLASLAEWRLG